MRKKPLQSRSRQMVDTLVEATAQTIAELGLSAATTNHIAERAGVSVGSLYQYFDGKESLVHALLDRISAELAQLVDRRLDATMDQDVRIVTIDLLTAVFDFMEQDQSCYLELVRNWQQLRSQRTILALERHMLEACRQYLLRHHDEFHVRNLPAALFVVISSTLYTIVHYLSQPRPYLQRKEVIDSLADMISSYLRAGAKPQARQAGVRRRKPGPLKN
ncbi:MAG TPA: TetR/AcrR family transcriptional regulator [Stenotrophobium sp.]|jgi:AcrR family transcriptional regulator|nr:TetR/AcrR family transcriptional regulator [Stenotrophobium sp.]